MKLNLLLTNVVSVALNLNVCDDAPDFNYGTGRGNFTTSFHSGGFNLTCAVVGEECLGFTLTLARVLCQKPELALFAQKRRVVH